MKMYDIGKEQFKALKREREVSLPFSKKKLPDQYLE
jgi:hypothetical protein